MAISKTSMVLIEQALITYIDWHAKWLKWHVNAGEWHAKWLKWHANAGEWHAHDRKPHANQ